MRPPPADQPDDGRYDADCPIPTQRSLRCIPRWRSAAALPLDVIVTVLTVLALGLLVVASACVFAGERVAGQPWR